jgi:hypothetical protein
MEWLMKMGVRIANVWVKNVRVKFTVEQATKAQRGSRGITVLFL